MKESSTRRLADISPPWNEKETDKNIFHITRDENAVQLAQSEVSEIIKNNSVENSIDNANENANNLGE